MNVNYSLVSRRLERSAGFPPWFPRRHPSARPTGADAAVLGADAPVAGADAPFAGAPTGGTASVPVACARARIHHSINHLSVKTTQFTGLWLFNSVYQWSNRAFISLLLIWMEWFLERPQLRIYANLYGHQSTVDYAQSRFITEIHRM